MKKTFITPIEMAHWITSNVLNPLRQDELMRQGLRHHTMNGTYHIQLNPNL